MEQKLNRYQIVELLKDKTGFYMKHIDLVLDALEEVIIENMRAATLEEQSELRLFRGIKIGGKFIPAGEKRDPRDGSTMFVGEHFNPYVSFTNAFRNKINNYKVEDKEGDSDELMGEEE